MMHYSKEALHKLFLNEIVLRQKIDQMENCNYDEIEIYKFAVDNNLLAVIRFLIREKWNPQYIDISYGDQDLLLDILDIYPCLFYKLEKHLEKWAVDHFLNTN